MSVPSSLIIAGSLVHLGGLHFADQNTAGVGILMIVGGVIFGFFKEVLS